MFSSNCRLLPCALIAVAGCGAPKPPPADAVAPVPINTPPQETEPTVSEAPSVKSRFAPIDLVADDGALLLHIDLHAMRSSVFYEPIKMLIKDDSYDVRRIVERCGIDPFDALDEVAISLHSFEREEPLLVASLAIAPEAAEKCIRDLWTDGHELEIDGHPAHVSGDSSRAISALTADNLLFIGRPLDIRRALGRREAGGRCEPLNLRAALAMSPQTPLSVILESSYEEVEHAEGKVTMAGARIELSGKATHRDRRRHTGVESARQAKRQLLGAQAELRGLISHHLGANHPLVGQLDRLVLEQKGKTVTAKLVVQTDASMKKQVKAAMTRFRLEQTTGEAKNHVGAITRGAAAAYERETVAPNGKVVHRPCASAQDVPSTVPKARKHQPVTQIGYDFETGDADSGWQCLKFGLSQPHHYQYAYRQGKNYKGPARGLPSPGPKGFEASAEGDLDGDGKTSLFTRIGVIDPRTGKLTISQLYIVDELE